MRRGMLQNQVVISIGCLLVFGCAHSIRESVTPCRAYAGPERPSHEVALLDVRGTLSFWLCRPDQESCVDSREWKNRPQGCHIQVIELEPAPVVMYFSFQTAGWSFMRSFQSERGTITFTPKVGRNYFLTWFQWAPFFGWACAIGDYHWWRTVVRNNDCTDPEKLRAYDHYLYD